jgi:hypothetical protein
VSAHSQIVGVLRHSPMLGIVGYRVTPDNALGVDLRAFRGILGT